MRNSTIKRVLGSVGAALVAASAWANTPISFETEAEQSVKVGGEWYSAAGAEATFGETNLYTEAEKESLPMRAAAFKDTPTNVFFEVDTGAATLYRTREAEQTAPSDLTEKIYLDTLATFVPSEAPAVDMTTNAVKILLWMGGDSRLHVTAGRIETSLYAGGTVPYDYATTNTLESGRFYRVVVKALPVYTALPGTAFSVYLDGVPVKVPAGVNVVASAAEADFRAAVTNEAYLAYERGELFPSMVAGESTLLGLGVEGNAGTGIDDLVITNSVNNEVAADTRYLILSTELGFKSFTYSVNGGESVASGDITDLAAVIPIALPVGTESTVKISDVQYADGTGFAFDNAEACSGADATITIPAGTALARITLTLTGINEFCRLTYKDATGASITSNCTSFAEAFKAFNAAGAVTEALIRLRRNCRVEAKQTLTAGQLTLDLSGRALYREGFSDQYVQVEGGSLTVKDSAGTGEFRSPKENTGCSLYCKSGELTLTGGRYYDNVRVNMGTGVTCSLTGGRYYNNSEGDTFTLARYVAPGYTNTWYEAGYWRVAKGGSSPVAPTAFMRALNLLGVQNASALGNNGDETIELVLSELTTETTEAGTRVSYLVTITNGDMSVKATPENLCELIRYSSDLRDWLKPTASQLKACTEEKIGHYRCTLELPAGQNYFIKISE